MTKTPGGNKKTIGSIRSKAGLPAKAGRRKLYSKGAKRKTKHFGEGRGFIMEHAVKESHFPPAGVAKINGLRRISELQRNDTSLNSDVYCWERVKAHYIAGIVTSKDIQEKTFA